MPPRRSYAQGRRWSSTRCRRPSDASSTNTCVSGGTLRPIVRARSPSGIWWWSQAGTEVPQVFHGKHLSWASLLKHSCWHRVRGAETLPVFHVNDLRLELDELSVGARLLTGALWPIVMVCQVPSWGNWSGYWARWHWMNGRPQPCAHRRWLVDVHLADSLVALDLEQVRERSEDRRYWRWRGLSRASRLPLRLPGAVRSSSSRAKLASATSSNGVVAAALDRERRGGLRARRGMAEGDRGP